MLAPHWFQSHCLMTNETRTVFGGPTERHVAQQRLDNRISDNANKGDDTIYEYYISITWSILNPYVSSQTQCQQLIQRQKVVPLNMKGCIYHKVYHKVDTPFHIQVDHTHDRTNSRSSGIRQDIFYLHWLTILHKVGHRMATHSVMFFYSQRWLLLSSLSFWLVRLDAA